MTEHPWRRFREMTESVLSWHHGGVMGWCRHSTQEVSMRLGMSQAERRSTIAHESVHLERGPAIKGYGQQEERIVDDVASRRLIGLDELIDGMCWCYGEEELAEHLWVDVPTLVARLKNLTAAESAHIDAELDRREASF